MYVSLKKNQSDYTVNNKLCGITVENFDSQNFICH